MGRAPCCDKANVKRGPWSHEEDTALKNFIQTHGTGGNWISLPPKAGLNRCGKSCRLRWLNYLRPDIKHGEFTQEEDTIIYTLFKNMGSRWSVIASQLPGRTDNDVKNHWNTKLKKKYFNTSIQLHSQVSPTKSADQQNYYYSFSSTSTSPSLNQIPSSSTANGAGVPIPGVLQMEFGSSSVVNNTTTNYSIDSSSNHQDQISADPSPVSSSLANLDNTNNNTTISWSGGDEEFDSFLMDFGFGELLNTFEFQQNK